MILVENRVAPPYRWSVNVEPPIAATDFVECVTPLLQAKDAPGLHALLCERWTADQIVGLLSSDDKDARKLAGLALSMVGGSCCLPALTTALRDPDPMVNQMAEHALWSIWFRLGEAEAAKLLCQGAQALSRRDFPEAVHFFEASIRRDPSFAEPYNQRAIAHYLSDRFEDSIRDCQRAIRRMPDHFGAWAGMGHCHAHLGQISQAIECYQKSLSINPHSECLRQALAEMKSH